MLLFREGGPGGPRLCFVSSDLCMLITQRLNPLGLSGGGGKTFKTEDFP